MSTLPRIQPEARRAALALHGLSEADSAWVLQALPAAQRAILQPLLAELQELGLPSDAAMAQELLQPQPAGPAQPATGLQALDRQGVTALARLLRAEPPQLVARLLAAQPWAWRTQLLARLAPTVRQQVATAAASVRAAPCLDAAIVRTLEQALQAAPNPGRRAVPAAWQALRSKLRISRSLS